MAKLTRSLYFKLLVSITVCIIVIGAINTWYQLKSVRSEVEKQVEDKGMALAKAGALSTAYIAENDLKAGVITSQKLFSRNYTKIGSEQDAKNQRYKSDFDDYSDTHWLGVEDSLLMDNDVAFSIASAYSDDPKLNGYIPTHNSRFEARSKRIFNDPVGSAVASTLKPIKQVYNRDTGEVMWDFSYPIYINGQHWGGFRVGLYTTQIEAVQTISSAIQEMSEYSGEMGPAMDNIAYVTQQNAAATQGLATGADDVITSMERITDYTTKSSEHTEKILQALKETGELTSNISEFAQTLAQMAHDQADIVNKFKYL